MAVNRSDIFYLDGLFRPHFLGPFLDFQYPRGLKGRCTPPSISPTSVKNSSILILLYRLWWISTQNELMQNVAVIQFVPRKNCAYKVLYHLIDLSGSDYISIRWYLVSWLLERILDTPTEAHLLEAHLERKLLLNYNPPAKIALSISTGSWKICQNFLFIKALDKVVLLSGIRAAAMGLHGPPALGGVRAAARLITYPPARAPHWDRVVCNCSF